MQRTFIFSLTFSFIFFVSDSLSMEEENRQRKLTYLDLETEKLLPTWEKNLEQDPEKSKRRAVEKEIFHLRDNEQYYTHEENSLHRRKRAQNHLEKLDTNIVERVISDCPSRLQTFVKIIKRRRELGKPPFLKDEQNSHTITLVGPPGVGKTYLATAISQYCDLPVDFVQVTKLGNQYIRSAQTEVNEIFESALNLNAPCVIFFDELHKIVQEEGGKKNEDIAGALWQSLDSIKASNILFIGTANELGKLPEQLRQRLSANCYTISLPTYNTRREIINFKIGNMPSVSFLLDSNDTDDLAKKTKDFAIRDLDHMFEEARNIARDIAVHIRDKEVFFEETPLEITKEHFLEAITLIKKDRLVFRPWYVKTYEFIKPGIIPVGMPILLTGLGLSLTYYLYVQGTKTQKDTYDQQERFHAESVVQYKDQLETNKMNTLFDAGNGIGEAVKLIFPGIGATISIASLVGKVGYIFIYKPYKEQIIKLSDYGIEYINSSSNAEKIVLSIIAYRLLSPRPVLT